MCSSHRPLPQSTAVACFKMTMGRPNIMAFWHNLLHDITGWMQQKIELMNRNWQVDNFSKFIKGKHWLFYGEKLKKFKSPFWQEKNYQYWSRSYQKMQNSNIWKGKFPTKSWFCHYLQEIMMILDFFVYNGTPFKSQKYKIMIISWKYWQNQLFLKEKYP